MRKSIIRKSRPYRKGKLVSRKSRPYRKGKLVSRKSRPYRKGKLVSRRFKTKRLYNKIGGDTTTTTSIYKKIGDNPLLNSQLVNAIGIAEGDAFGTGLFLTGFSRVYKKQRGDQNPIIDILLKLQLADVKSDDSNLNNLGSLHQAQQIITEIRAIMEKNENNTEMKEARAPLLNGISLFDRITNSIREIHERINTAIDKITSS